MQTLTKVLRDKNLKYFQLSLKLLLLLKNSPVKGLTRRMSNFKIYKEHIERWDPELVWPTAVRRRIGRGFSKTDSD